ncbi:hypothetical protein ABEB36_009146 [Hypothenemus hampei]|uniref:Tetraspanin n=1 Tax=Hypothenemus hampei TaxID=57062 RepID=A0ABD1EPB7_HYPHA
MVDCNAIMRNYSRYMLVIFNFFFVLTGVIIVSVGISAKAYYNEYDHLLDDKYFYVSNLVISVGAVIFIIAFFGCYGAAKENACMTTTFSTLLIIIFILEALIGIGGFVLRHKTEQILEQALNDTLKEYKQNDTQEITATWDAIQREFHCCGVTNYTNWFNSSSYFPLNSTSLPLTCCDIPAGSIGYLSCNSSSTTLHNETCLEAFGDRIRENTSAIEIVGIVLAVIQLLGIILSCYLAKQIRSDYETV